MKGRDVVVSIIIPNWNGIRFLEECFQSIEKQTFSSFEVIFVDNGSADGSADWVASQFGHLARVIRNEKNLGFAEGNNVGIRLAKGEYIVLLNNDTVVDPRWLEELIKPVEADPTVGMCASKVLSHQQPEVLEGTGELLFRDGLNRARGHLELDRGQYDSDVEILFPPGCGALYRREVLEEIGLFDADFFAYGEDADLGLRARLAGWRCIYAPRAVLYHKGSGSTGRYSAFKAFYVERNRVWVAVKLFPFRLLILNPVYTLLRLFFQGYGALTHRGAAGQYTREYSLFSLFWILLRAYGSAMKFIPRMWRKRKVIQKSKKMKSKDFFDWLRRYGISARKIALMN